MFTIFGTAMATVLISAPAQAGISAPVHAVPAAPSAQGTGAITGVVDGAGGRPLTGACVVASGPAGSALAVTTSDGRYTLTGLQAGRYALRYSACAASGDYADQWWGGASWPDRPAKMSIAAGQLRQLGTITLRSAAPALPSATGRFKTTAGAIPGLSPQAMQANTSGQASGGTGAIAGTVTGGGKPLGKVCVLASGSGRGGHTVTSNTGKYRIAKLRAASYEVVFFPRSFCGKNTGNWLEQLYKGITGPPFRGKPTRVPVKAGKTTSGIDAALRLGGEITGTVKSQAGKTLSGVCVEADGRQGRAFVEGFAVSDKHGGYVIHSLSPGKYVLVFIPRACGNSGNFVPQWWRNSATQKHATKITITSGLTVKGIDAALRPGGVISGVVRGGSPHGALLKGVCVFAEATKGPFFGFSRVVTNKNGAYRLTGLTTGKYELIYTRSCGNGGNFLEAKRTVSVVVGHVKSGVDAFLPVGAIISGKVTDTHGNPVSGICVAITGHGFSAARTAADGTYSAIALPSGQDRVQFSGGCRNTGSFAPQFYKGQLNSGSANLVTATTGRTTAGINAVMRPGATITGIATDSSGKRLNKLCVQVQSPSEAQSGFPFGRILLTKNGVYTVQNLTPGAYAVDFGCIFGKLVFASQWFRGQASQGFANFVSAPAGRITAGVSAVMRPGGSISGKVTSSSGQAMANVCVQISPHGGPPPGSVFRFPGHSIAFTNRSGFYTIAHLGPAKYDVQFGCIGNRFPSQWYKATASRAAATPVTVANKVTTTGINAVMTAGGSISGIVTAAGHPQSRVCVSATDANDFAFGQAVTSQQGHYTMKGLASGSYQVTFFDCGGGKQHVKLGTATLPHPVNLVAPHAVTAVNAKLFPAGSITGTVLGGSAATPQSGVCVVAVPQGAANAVESAESNTSGTYKLTRLAPGTYKVYLGDPSCVFADNSFAPQWYKGKSSEASATGVKVVAGTATTGIGATLGGDGTITGVVSTLAHKPVTGACVTATPVNPVPDPLAGAVPHPVVAISSGSYALTGLVPGQYTVEFSTGCGASGFHSQWWHNAGSAGQATVITVPASGTINGISANVH